MAVAVTRRFRRCRCESLARASIVPSLRLLRRFLSSQAHNAPLNLFEIDLRPFEAPVASTEKFALGDAQRALALQQPTDAQHEIDVLHNEMSALFGEEVAEHEEETLAPSVDEEAKTVLQRGAWMKDRAVTPSSRAFAAGARVACDTLQGERGQLTTTPGVMRADAASTTKEEVTGGRKLVSRNDNAVGAGQVDVLLLHGPCSFVRGVWTGGDVKKAELRQQIHELADDLKIVVESRNYNSEKRILENLLEAHVDQVILLYWNIKSKSAQFESKPPDPAVRWAWLTWSNATLTVVCVLLLLRCLQCAVSLSKSPFIVRALELVQSKAIVVSPGNIEHGPLPANVVGVLSGFRQQSLSLALHAAAKLLVADAREGRKCV